MNLLFSDIFLRMNQFCNLVLGVHGVGLMGLGKDLNFTRLVVIKFKIPVSYSSSIVLPFPLPFLSQLLLGLAGGPEENHASLFYFPPSHTLVQLIT